MADVSTDTRTERCYLIVYASLEQNVSPGYLPAGEERDCFSNWQLRFRLQKRLDFADFFHQAIAVRTIVDT
jgi:hypothetical protein